MPRSEPGGGDQAEPSRPVSARPVTVVVETRYLSQRQPAALVSALERRGVEVAVVDVPERAGCALAPLAAARAAESRRPGAVVARGRSRALLALLSRLEEHGARVVNRPAAIAAVLDKGRMAAAIAGAGLPTPRSHVGTLREVAAAFADRDFPLVLKPVFGDNGRGLALVESREALSALAWPEPTALAQPLIQSDGLDLKLYVAGRRVWAVHKPSPLSAPCPGAAAGGARVTAGLEALALRCGALFGLELYGVDCIETPGGPIVIEVNDYPNYSGIPEADERIADLVLDGGRPGRAP